MAYCVHCGVKLGDAETHCPLCGTPVLDPSEPDRKIAEKSFPVHTPEQKMTMSRRYLLILLSLIMLVPAALCLIIDLLLNGRVVWSSYPSAALVLMFSGTAVPLMFKQHRLYISASCGYIATALYLAMCSSLSHTEGWFLPIALPVLTLAFICLMALIILNKKGIFGILTTIGGVLLSSAMVCTLCECLYSLRVNGAVSLQWSPFASAPCAFLSLIVFLINGYRPLREELRRRMHF